MSSTESSQGGGLEILAKADAVIQALEGQGELTAAAIAVAVDEPMSSTYRLLTNLASIGWVDPGSRRGLFRLGVQFMRIGGRLEDQISVRDAAVPSLKALLASTGATSFLCLRRGTRAVCVERFEGRDVRSLAMSLGDSLPLYLGAAPVALFAHLPDSERGAVIEQLDSSRAADASIPSRAELNRIAEETRVRGYSISDGDVTPGIAAIGAPVFNHRGEIEAALSISGLRALVLSEDRSTIDLVLDAALTSSRALGYLGGEP
ncbi:iclR family transcriptional regulator [Cryobacterium roopkundense]|uniref:IclR family transcriptional regulator n=1 Tax=Cryobacterium roopkundense TaxID=1001240 RepID=A0A099J408_9MICO|nr:IclR family transcriptional regulator [Cryobacterium roopkundense]KGJ72820.1 iclR family transcriptional regulator [Cryobacterium roopkundense]MBB5642888.1 DNA-binding IclR family transcriptional regulator [Cryobacterium roopkundense]